jgi:hypothetical protein
MKSSRFALFTRVSKTLRSNRSAFVAPLMVLTMSVAQAGTSTPPAAPAEPEAPANWITFSVGGWFVNGDDAGMTRRTQSNGDFYGGIESLMFSRKLNDSTTLTLDGHALPGLEDYEFNLDLTKDNLGYVKAGYKQFRTWYDASGGYLRGVAPYAIPFGDERSIDRGELFFEAGLRMENVPEITFLYKHTFRDGQKDSTCWGDNARNPSFKMMPALWDIDEESDLFELDITHTLGNTDLALGFVYEHDSYSDARYTPRYSRNSAVVPNTYGVENITMTERTSTDMVAGNFSSVTRFNDKAWLSFAFAVNNTNSDFNGGDRLYAHPRWGPVGSRDYSYSGLDGGSNMNQVITNLNFMWSPIADLTITPSLRYEHESIDITSNFRAFIDGGTNASNVFWNGLQSYNSNSDMDSTVGALDIRYSGISDLVLYAKGQWGYEDETVKRQDNIYDHDLIAGSEWLKSDIEVQEQEYVLGVNWYAARNLSFSLQGFHSERDQSFDHRASNQSKVNTAAGRLLPGGANNLRPIMDEHNVDVDDINFRVTWRPMSNLTLVTRYDYRLTEYDNRGIRWLAPPANPKTILPNVESGVTTSNIISESITWSPMDRLYVQGTASYIWSHTDTDFTGITDSDNDYFSGTLTAGYSIDDKTEITGSFTYYGASNYQVATSAMGYGLNTEEYGLNLTLTRMLTPNMIWNLRYGFITSNTDGEDQSGGYDDFTAQMVSTGLQIRF